MRLPQSGGCLCGAVRYEITQPPLVTYTCHCTTCQRLTGSAFSSAVLVAAEALPLRRRRLAVLRAARR
ncbi:GFA family protein [Dankookia sp. P2]|uniref:GFA family protein n=1 Tax=Dankookia sp. P2 TaxID=3423955 RepID=UPI003D679EB7